jgi:hypothetical protein
MMRHNGSNEIVEHIHTYTSTDKIDESMMKKALVVPQEDVS